MLKYEIAIEKNYKPSIFPWDPERTYFPPDMLLAVSKAIHFLPAQNHALTEIDGNRIIIAFSSNFGRHSTAHLWSAELKAGAFAS
jgi:hypothetical protein